MGGFLGVRQTLNRDAPDPGLCPGKSGGRAALPLLTLSGDRQVSRAPRLLWGPGLPGLWRLLSVNGFLSSNPFGECWPKGSPGDCTAGLYYAEVLALGVGCGRRGSQEALAAQYHVYELISSLAFPKGKPLGNAVLNVLKGLCS